MNIKEIVQEMNRAGDVLIEASYVLLDRGRDVRSNAHDMETERVDVGYLSVIINDVEHTIDRLQGDLKDAVAMLRRLPYEGEVTYW